MFQLLQPIWLYAIAGIALPLFIHLWNVRGGKKLLIGSVSLIDESSRQQGRSLRFTEILLLIIRCLLIISLAFLLARPSWKKQLSSTSEKGWILIEKESVHEAYKNFKPSIDSLLSAGYSFHYFNKGFSQARFEDALTTSDSISQVESSYWTLLKELNEQVPADLPVHLYTDNKLKRFFGKRPEVSMLLTWNTFRSADTLSREGVQAFRTPTDSIRIISAISSSSATFYTSENIPKTGSSQYTLLDNKIQVSGNNTKREIDLDTSSLHITIYTDQFATDAHYVKAALEAIQQYTQRDMQVLFVNQLAEIKSGLDWLFWLSEKPVAPPQVANNIFVYEKGTEEQVDSWMTGMDDFGINQEFVKLTRRIKIPATTQDNFETIWKDGFGSPLLTKVKAKPNMYYYFSRFNPDWNDLPWSSQFAEMLFNLVIDQENAAVNKLDNRMIAGAQMQPIIKNEKKLFDKQKFVNTTDLGKFFWLAAFVIFCIERFLSLRKHNKKLYA